MADLDRLITLQVRAPGMRDDEGRFQPGAVSFSGKVWARYLRTQQSIDLQPGGGLTVHDRRFRIRWRRDVIEAATYQLQVTDDIGIVYNIAQVATGDDRRRYLELLCLRTSP